MTYSTLQSQIDLGSRFPARSIPNLPNEVCSIATTNDTYALARSSSQPADMWARELIVDTVNLFETHHHPHHMQQHSHAHSHPLHHHSIDNGDHIKLIKANVTISTSTQTENNNIDLSIIENFIASNPRLVFKILGISEPPSYHANGGDKQQQQHQHQPQPSHQQTIIAMPESYLNLSTDSPDSNHQKRFAFGISNPLSPSTSKSIIWDSPQNSSNKNTDHCRSTDALLAISSDDCLLQSTENISSSNLIQGLTTAENVSYAIALSQHRGDGTGASSSGGVKAILERKQSNNTGSMTSSGSASNTKNTGCKRKILRKDSNNSMSSTSSSNSSLNSNRKLVTVYNEMKLTTIKQQQQHQQQRIKDNRLNQSNDTNDGGDAANDGDDDEDEDGAPIYDELNEKCALLAFNIESTSQLSHEGRKSGINRSSTTDLQKRSHLVPKPPFNYRFSAGDADKLEKGIKNLPSTRSLKDPDSNDK